MDDLICELLGVPYEDREAFQDRAARTIDFNLPVEERRQVTDDSRAYMAGLVDRHRAQPGEDLLSRLIMRHASSGDPDDLTDDDTPTDRHAPTDRDSFDTSGVGEEFSASGS